MQYVYRVMTTDFREDNSELIPPIGDLPWELKGQPVADQRFRTLTATWRCPKALVESKAKLKKTSHGAYRILEDLQNVLRQSFRERESQEALLNRIKAVMEDKKNAAFIKSLHEEIEAGG